MKRGIDIIRALLCEPTEYERMLALDVLSEAWKEFTLTASRLGDRPPLWVLPADAMSKVISFTFDSLFSRDVQ